MQTAKKVGIYSPYLTTLGGGERYIAGVAKVFGEQGFQVDWWWPDATILNDISSRFGLSLTNSSVNPQSFHIQTQGNWWDKLRLHQQYHSLFFVSDGSVPLLWSKKKYLHFQVPFLADKKPTLFNRLKTKNISEVICNSRFTKTIIDASYSVTARVLYPPVTLIAAEKKRNLILSVGRFDSPMHPKRQDVLINAFLSLNLTDWELVLAGGCLDTTALEPLTLLANQSPQISILPNPSHAALHKLYAQSKIYWHAAGFGASESEPFKAEHFGIAIVEAMSAGAVPIAYKMGGPLEIIDQAHTGYLWETLEQLQKLTRDMTYHEDKARVLSANAKKHARIFSEEAFGANLTAIIS
jgi:glycosyltransferase involved in cell wall biosynthesis